MASVPEIKVQFKRTQNPFNLTLYPVSYEEAIERFHVDNFIFDLPQIEDERATAGKVAIINGDYFPSQKYLCGPIQNLPLPGCSK